MQNFFEIFANDIYRSIVNNVFQVPINPLIV